MNKIIIIIINIIISALLYQIHFWLIIISLSLDLGYFYILVNYFYVNQTLYIITILRVEKWKIYRFLIKKIKNWGLLASDVNF